MMAALSEPLAGPRPVSIQSWDAPQIAGLHTPVRRIPEDLDGEERNAYREAEAAGRAAGLEAARLQIEAQQRNLDETARCLENALAMLARPLAHVDDEVHGQVAQLAIALARQLVRRELRADPSQIIGIVRETVSLLPVSARGVRVALHPEDAALVRDRLPTGGPEAAWHIVEDPALARGDCRVNTEHAQVDGRIETRLHEVAALLLGEERGQPRAEGAP